MASAGNEAELDPRARVANRKELFVAVFIDNDGRELAAGCLQGGVGVAGIQDLDSDVVNPAAVFGEVLSDIGASFGSDQNQGDPACGDRGDARGLVGWRSRMKPELLGQRSGGLSQVGDGNDDMVNAARDGVDGRADTFGRSSLFGWSVGTATSNFDAMGFAEHDPHDVFGEIGVDALIDRVLAASRHDIADSFGLNDRSVTVLFDASDLVTDVDSFGQDVEKLLIKGVDALAESQEFGRRIGGRHLCKGTSHEPEEPSCFF